MTTFEPELTELTIGGAAGVVSIYKLGGGTLGRRYSGPWGYRIERLGAPTVQGTADSGLPKTHLDMALLVLEDVVEGADRDDPLAAEILNLADGVRALHEQPLGW